MNNDKATEKKFSKQAEGYSWRREPSPKPDPKSDPAEQSADKPAAPDKPAVKANNKTNDAANGHARAQPDTGKETSQQNGKPDGWTLDGGTTPDWAPLDMTAGSSELPPAGAYPATVADMKMIDTNDALRAILSFALDGMEAAPAPLWVTLGLRHAPPNDHRIVEGMRNINALAKATATPLAGRLDAHDLPGLLIGKKLNLVVGHQTRHDVSELVVRAFRPL